MHLKGNGRELNMNIGILTVYFADYGSFQHATSLYKYLESMGHRCELINESLRYKRSKLLYISSIFEKYAPQFLKKYLGKKITAFNTYVILKKELNRYRISPKCKSVCEISDRYDCIIVGSDELWSSTNKTIRYIPEYFGISITKPHFSYSTSGITMRFPNPWENEIKQGLSTFEALAVRDIVTAEWVERLTNQKATIVLDPALLFPYYQASSAQVEQGQRYVIVYGEHFLDEQICWIQDYARYRKLKLCSVVWRHAWCDSHIETPSSDNLQQVFANAAHSMSSTFHGTIFSIVNHVPFTVFLSPARGKKIELLLEDLNCSQYIYTSNADSHIDMTIDYGVIDNLLSQKRKYSENWLLEQLSNIERSL